ncbi:MAG: glycosyltransferase family 2 protein [Candidatus Woesearchaeota archaeon]
MTSKVSVIIPVFNLEEYLSEGVQSIIDQTLQNIEIIIVNDGSTDNTLEIAKTFSEKDNRITLINLKKNQGQSAARNTGLRITKGKYIYFFDGDDILKKDALEKCYNTAEKYDLDIVNFDADTFYHQNSKNQFSPNYNRNNMIPDKVFSDDEYFDFLVTNNILKVSVPLNLIKKKIILKNKLSFKKGIIHEDDLFTTKLYILASRIKHLNCKYYLRRIRPNSTMTTAKSEKNVYSYMQVVENLYEFYLNKYRKKTLERRIQSLLNSIIYLTISLNKDKKYFKKIKTRILKRIPKILNLKMRIKLQLPKLFFLYLKFRRSIKTY